MGLFNEGEIITLVCPHCECLNPTNTNLCGDCGSRIVLDKKTREKSILVSATFEYRQWAEERINSFNSLSKDEKREMCGEARRRIKELMKTYNNTKREITNKEHLGLIDKKMIKLIRELSIIDKLAASVDKHR